MAMENAPEICAHCTGWGHPWSVSPDDDWSFPSDHFGERYEEGSHGPDIEQLPEDAEVISGY